MKFIRIFIFILFNTLILVSFNFKLVNSTEIVTIKANEARLYFGGLFPSYIFYMQGGIPEDTASAWVDKEYWAVLEIDKSSKVHGGESTIFKLKEVQRQVLNPSGALQKAELNLLVKDLHVLKHLLILKV